MHTALYSIIGSLLILATMVDVVWTTLGTHGGGPISGPVNAGLWKGVLQIHKRWPHHRALSFVGSVLIVVQLLLWTTMLWAGWVFIYSARGDAVLNMQTRLPADLVSRVYFVGGNLFTVGSGELVPNGKVYRFLAAVTSGIGLGTLTLAVTFILQVLAAVVEKRTLGAYISDLGGTPEKVLRQAWTGESFDSLRDHLLALTTMLHLHTEQNLAYPILHYFHSENHRTATTLRIAALDEIVLLLAEGVKKEFRLSPMVVQPLIEAIAGLAETIEGQYVNPPEEPPPPPPLAILREIGVPTVDDQTFAESVEKHRDTRRVLAGLLRDDGWPWERIFEKRASSE